MRPSIVAGAVLATLGLVALAAVGFGWSFQRAAMLAPVIVVCAGAIAGLLILWGKAALSNLAKTSDAQRSVREPDGLEDSTLSSRPGASARGGDRP
jgi:hypothetical protein